MSEKWVILMESINETEADIICGLLESGGIQTRKKETGPFAGLRVIMGQAQSVQVCVRQEDFKRAKVILTKAGELAAEDRDNEKT